MPRLSRSFSALVIALSSIAVVAPASAADTWPSKPVRIVGPYGPGGSAATLGRLAAQKLTEALGQQFVIENRAGAGGLVRSEIVAPAGPAGQTANGSGS